MRVALATAITVWTLAAWGGRIGLLSTGEGLGAWLRIGGSLAVGLLAAASLVFPQMERARKPILIVFSGFTVVLWMRSLAVNWLGNGSLAFKLVHTVLAAGFFALSWWAYRIATSDSSPTTQHEQVAAQADRDR